MHASDTKHTSRSQPTLRARAGDRFVEKRWGFADFPPGEAGTWSLCWIKGQGLVDLCLCGRSPQEISRGLSLPATPIAFCDHGDRIELFPVPDRDLEIYGR